MAWHLSSTAVVAACWLAIGLPAPSRADPLAGTRWRDRVLLVLAPRSDDPRLAQQRSLFQHMGRDARERDLKLVEVVGDTPDGAALRKRFGLPDGVFQVLLIGKDGGDKMRSDVPLAASSLFPTIDAMPMRQDEMRRRS